MVLLLILLLPDFANVAGQAGLDGPPSGRSVFVDLNGDGQLDVVLDREHFFLKRGERFERVPGLPFIPDLMLFADFDNDGDQDCFAGVVCEPENAKWKDHGHSNTLFLNDGKGVFKARELNMPRTTVRAACAFDYDRDGNLDLFVGSGYRVYGQSYACYPDRLYRGKGDGSFEDVTRRAKLLTIDEPGKRKSSKPTYGVTHGDWNGDGLQDIWVCTYGRQWNFLWQNNGDGTFTDVAARAGFDGDRDRSGKYPEEGKRAYKRSTGEDRVDEMPFRANGNTFDCAVADFDNDGDQDCILAEITHWWAGPSSDRTSLLVNRGGVEAFTFEHRSAVFERPRIERWNQGDIHAGWIDFDNDGLLDAVIASSDYVDRQELKLYRQRPDHTFEAARTFDWEGAGQLSIADYDNDGDQDILVGRSLNRLPAPRRRELGPSVALFRNDVGNKNHWLQVVCRGKTANRDGIGCRIEATTADGVTQTREIRCGLGHVGHNGPPIAHFGLGRHAKADLVVWWPDRAGTKSEVRAVEAGQRLVVRQ
ncbi:MAG: CRTAC1 family protein [Planctomycetota bacterium]|nr:CRTAC1 family protein [Planctomycetota bacterium]